MTIEKKPVVFSLTPELGQPMGLMTLRGYLQEELVTVKTAATKTMPENREEAHEHEEGFVEKQYRRLYLKADRNSFFDIPVEEVKGEEKITDVTFPEGQSFVWVNRVANLRYSEIGAERPLLIQAKYLDGLVIDNLGVFLQKPYLPPEKSGGDHREWHTPMCFEEPPDDPPLGG